MEIEIEKEQHIKNIEKCLEPFKFSKIEMEMIIATMKLTWEKGVIVGLKKAIEINSSK